MTTSTRNRAAEDVAITTAALAVCALAFAWIHAATTNQLTHLPVSVLILPCLLAGMYVARHHPIHVHTATKVYVTSVAYYLTAVLLPPPIAALAVLVGSGVAAWSVRSRTRNSLWNITIQTSRWTGIVLVGSTIAHLSDLRADTIVLFGATALFMWAADILTFPLLYTPYTGENPLRAIRMAGREAGPVEGAQYLVAIIAALGARDNLWALIFIIPLTILVYLAFRRANELSSETRRLIESMADAVDLRDPYVGGHSHRVAALTREVLREMGKRGADVELVVSAARVHDIGKIGIPDGILRKPDALTLEEQALMATHPERGAELLARYAEFKRGISIIRHHHESWDGTGYPHRLKGAEIPFGARVVAVVDSYDAMTTDRPYRRAMSPEAAAAVLRVGRGHQWDPAVVDALLRTLHLGLDQTPAPALHIVPDREEADVSSA